MTSPIRAAWLRRATLPDIARYRRDLRAALEALEIVATPGHACPLPARALDHVIAASRDLRRALVDLEERTAAPDGWPPAGSAP